MGGSRTVEGVGLRWAARTDVGRVRSVNEDSLLAEAPVFLVADGMGGHEAGDVASALAVQALSTLVDSHPDAPEEVSRRLGEANAGILAAGSAQSEERGMGTTAVGLVLLAGSGGPVWMLFNIGDSRIYRSLDGRLSQLSTDHSYVQELIDAGRITPSAALSHPQRNVVTRALGVDPDLDVDLWLRAPVVGERFLLCSDGLSGEVVHAALEDLLARDADPDVICAELIERALAGGGSDNITAIVVEVESIDGATISEYDTNPRDAATQEHHAVAPLGSTDSRGVDVAGPSAAAEALIEVPGAMRPEGLGADESEEDLIAEVPLAPPDDREVSDPDTSRTVEGGAVESAMDLESGDDVVGDAGDDPERSEEGVVEDGAT